LHVSAATSTDLKNQLTPELTPAILSAADMSGQKPIAGMPRVIVRHPSLLNADEAAVAEFGHLY
jgi:hypothetical protein